MHLRQAALHVMRKSFFLSAGLILLAGLFLRLPPALFASPAGPLRLIAFLHPQPGYQHIGFDEALYLRYVDELSAIGITSFPDTAERYIAIQTQMPGAILPPTRFLYIFCAYLWHQCTGAEALTSLKVVSSIFSMLLLVISTLFATRAGGTRIGLMVCALMAFAPTQIHMSQHALIDGFFAFWAVVSLWLLWENLERPNYWPLLSAYGLALALLVLTKENALFAYVGLLGTLGLCAWQKQGRITRLLLLATFVGPLLGVALLVNLCGSLSTTVQIYQLLVSKASVLPYAIATGDGPWYRYLIDLMIMSPVVLVLAIGGIFLVRRSDWPALYLLAFVVASYLPMANVRYGMNLRYTNMWDMPLRYLASICLTTLAERWGRHTRWALPAAVILVCLLELQQYLVFFVHYNLYELVTAGLLHAIRILK